MSDLKHSIAGLTLLGGLVLALAGCGGSQEAGDLDRQPEQRSGSAAPVYDLDFDGRTDKPAQVMALPGANYSVEPLLTVGDEIPLLTGDYPAGKAHKKRTYALPGIPDGLGIKKQGNNYWVWCNHEISSSGGSRYSDTVSGMIKGARVSLIKLDRNFSIIAGRNLIECVYDKTGLIGTVELNSDQTAVSQSGTSLSRLCSATLSEIYGQPFFFSGEESTNGRALLIETSGDATVIDDAVKMAYENIVPVSKWNDKTVLLLLDDSTDRYLVLYIGKRQGGSLGFQSGTCYVAQVQVNGVPQVNTAGLNLNAQNTVKWIEVPRSYDFDGAGPNPPQDLYSASAPYYQWAGTIAKATMFKRPEDGHEDPRRPGQLHFVTTGNTGAGSYDLYGRVWQLNLGNQPSKDASLRLTSIGDTDYYMNPDNVAIDSTGKFWLQEDPSGTQALMLGAGRVASIYRSPLGADSYVRLFEVNQDRAPFTGYGIPGFKDNPWETSGIVQLSEVKANGQVGLLFDCQAHGWADPDYVEGGQLILAFPKGFILPPDKGGSSVKGQKYEIKPENADESTGDEVEGPAAGRTVAAGK
ncbi:DUF839 domain-containing protein [bacterium]|nr:DUF839 domain-containing protein [bacterium]